VFSCRSGHFEVGGMSRSVTVNHQHRRQWGISCGVLVIALACGPGPSFGQPGTESGRRFALLVGVQEYQHQSLPTLRYTENDVVALGRLLKSGGYDVVVLSDAAGRKDPALAPTGANIAVRLKAILDQARRPDTIVIAFAGHGLQFERDSDGNVLQESYFCPSDARPFVDRRETLVALDQVYRDLEQSFAGVKVLFVDACRNDPKLSRGVRSGLTGDGGPQPPKGVAALFSCEAGQVAYEHETYQHGAFFYYVLEGLRGKAQNSNGLVTFASLADYVSREVSVDVPRVVGPDAMQSPNLRANLSGPSPVLLMPGSLRLAVGDSPVANDLKQLEAAFLRRGSTADQLKSTAPSRLTAWQAAAEGGDAAGQYLYARCLQVGVGVGADASTGFRWMLRAAEQELPIAQANIGVCYEDGDGVPADAQEAVRWYRRAADANHPAGLTALGVCLQTGRGVAKDAAVAVALYRRAAEQQSARAMCSLASCLQNGDGCPVDEREALRWYRAAADRGYVDAHNQVGWCLQNGIGSAADAAAALPHYRLGAEAGDADAQNNLGWNLLMGIGTTKNQAAAVPWFRKAAAQGNRRAQTSLGWCLQNGFGVSKNDAEAVVWLRKAADQGFPRAQGLLADCYERGRGIAANRSEAIRWHRQAAAQGDQESRNALSRLGAN